MQTTPCLRPLKYCKNLISALNMLIYFGLHCLLYMFNMRVYASQANHLINSALVGYVELLRPRFVLSEPSASADNTNLCLNNPSYPTRPHSIIV